MNVDTGLKIEFYQQLKLLNLVYRNANQFWISIVLAGLGMITSVGNFGLIRFGKVLNLDDLFMFIVFGPIASGLLLSMLAFTGHLPLYCEKLIEQVKLTNKDGLLGKRNSYLKKRLACLKRFGIPNGSVECLHFGTLYETSGAMMACLVTLLNF